MKKILALIALMAMSVTVQAQHEEGEFTIQPRLGITISNLTDGDKWKTNFTAGVEFEKFLTDEFSFSGGLLFTNQGSIYNSLNEKTGSNEKLTMSLYYGAIPLMANYYILPGLALKAGIQPAFRLKARVEQGGDKIDLDKFTNLIYGNDVKINKFDFSIPIGLSYEFKGVTLDARYNIGLTKLISSGDAVRNSVFVFTLGYKFTH